MRTSVRFGIIFGLIYVILRIGAHHLVDITSDSSWMFTFANLLLVMLAVFFAIFYSRKEEKAEDRTFIADFKSGMQGAGIYIIIYALFYLLFYYQIAPDYLGDRATERINNRVELFNKEYGENKEVVYYKDKELKINGELQASISTPKDTIDLYFGHMQDEVATTHSIYSVKVDMMISILGLFILSLFYAIFISVLIRRVLSKVM